MPRLSLGFLTSGDGRSRAELITHADATLSSIYSYLACLEISAQQSDQILVDTILANSYHSYYKSTLVFCKDPLLSSALPHGNALFEYQRTVD